MSIIQKISTRDALTVKYSPLTSIFVSFMFGAA